MTENLPAMERRDPSELGRLTSEIFERHATHGKRKVIAETYRDRLNTLLANVSEENKERIGIKLQKLGVTIGSYVSEYGSRFSDFVNNIVQWPLQRADKNTPKDLFYQISLARAQAWGDFAVNTTKTATAERNAYKNHFWSAALATAPAGAAYGAFVGATSLEGAKYGLLVGGLHGALIGAGAGAAIGGAYSLGIRLKDRIMGPPIAYYAQR
jgi:hypothetical protein